MGQKFRSDRGTQLIDNLTGKPSGDVLLGSLDDFLQDDTDPLSRPQVSWNAYRTSSNNLDDTPPADLEFAPLDRTTPLTSRTATQAASQSSGSIAIQSTTYSSSYGYGLVDAAAAVSQATGTSSPAEVADLGGSSQGLDQINAPEAWSQGYTGQNAIVAVIDTGVDYTHSDLDANIWTNSGEIAGNKIDDDGNGYVDDSQGWDFVNNDNDPMDEQSHGTHVAGIVAAENNGTGTTGVAYNAKIMAVRVLNEQGTGSTSDIAQGIVYAVDNGANVINLSLGGGISSDLVEAIEYASGKGAVVVMAAGNEGTNRTSAPASLAAYYGLAVGAVDRTNQLAEFSNLAGSESIDYVVAPGVSIESTTPNNTYTSYSGTSMATPYVSGVAALIMSANPNLSSAQVESIITQTADSSGITV